MNMNEKNLNSSFTGRTADRRKQQQHIKEHERSQVPAGGEPAESQASEPNSPPPPDPYQNPTNK